MPHHPLTKLVGETDESSLLSSTSSVPGGGSVKVQPLALK